MLPPFLRSALAQRAAHIIADAVGEAAADIVVTFQRWKVTKDRPEAVEGDSPASDTSTLFAVRHEVSHAQPRVGAEVEICTPAILRSALARSVAHIITHDLAVIARSTIAVGRRLAPAVLKKTKQIMIIAAVDQVKPVRQL